MKQEKICVTKRFNFEAAHMLAHHTGDCKNLHGHSYKLEVTVGCKSGMKEDMIVDFSDLKKIVNSAVIDRYDHAFIYWKNTDDEGERALADTAARFGHRLVAMEKRPTAENMLGDIANSIKKEFVDENLVLVRLKLWETEGSYGEVEFVD